MRVLFLVQGEGRGHLTQALSLAQMLQSAGHEVTGAVVGTTAERSVPTFFSDAFSAPITPVLSPGLVYDADTNELEPVTTALQAMRHAGPLWRSLAQVRAIIAQQKPCVVVNFYELLGGLTYALWRPSVPMICIAHQYMALHPNFQYPNGHWFAKQGFKINTRLTCLGAAGLLALSFDEQADEPGQSLRVVPPLLRQEVMSMQSTAGDFLLAYVTQPRLNTELLKAHRQHPEIRMDDFNADITVPDQVIDNTLIYHAIDGKRFLEFMARCKAIVTTAGFESVCEAAYLGKPALMIPQPNHFEQACNAIDGERAGMGIGADRFDLDQLLAYLPHHDERVSERFRTWHTSGSQRFLATLTSVAITNR